VGGEQTTKRLQGQRARIIFVDRETSTDVGTGRGARTFWHQVLQPSGPTLNTRHPASGSMLDVDAVWLPDRRPPTVSRSCGCRARVISSSERGTNCEELGREQTRRKPEGAAGREIDCAAIAAASLAEANQWPSERATYSGRRRRVSHWRFKLPAHVAAHSSWALGREERRGTIIGHSPPGAELGRRSCHLGLFLRQPTERGHRKLRDGSDEERDT